MTTMGPHPDALLTGLPGSWPPPWGHPVAIVDINDLGANIWASPKKSLPWTSGQDPGDNPWVSPANPHPMGIIRKV